MTFKRSVSGMGLLMAAVGGMVGSGRLFGPFLAAKVAGPAAIIAWLIGGLLMVLVALTFAELASTFPFSGGSIRFLQLSHGSIISFTMAWISWISCIAVSPIETMALIHYLAEPFPMLMRHVGDHLVLSAQGIMFAAMILFVMCWINAMGVKKLEKTNNFLVLLKLVISALTIMVLFSSGFHVNNFSQSGFAPYGWHGILAALPSAGVIFSYIGYSPAIQLAGEAKNPQRSVPIAIIGGLCICIVLYIALQTAFIGVLRPSDYAGGWKHLSFAGDSGPLVGLVIALGLPLFARVMLVDASISPFGTGLLYTGSTARMCYAMGVNGYFPKWLMNMNKHGVPTRLLGLNFILGMLLFLPFPTWQNMMSFLVSCLVFAYAIGPLALVLLRKQLPDQPRPFKLPCHRLLCLLAFYICNLIVFWTGWHIISKMLIVIASGYGLLFILSQLRIGFKHQLPWLKSLWLVFYVASTGYISRIGTFGGGTGELGFGWDFLAVALMTAFVFYWSLYCGLSGESSREQYQASIL